MKFIKAVFVWVRNLGTIKLFVLLAALGVFLLAFFMLSLEALHYSESTEFCTSCHNVMDAEILTHSMSPHSNTDCGTCHIGPGVVPRMLDKVYGMRYLVILPLDLFKRPLEIPLETLRPAREICEQCHWPNNFYPVRVVTKNVYAPDADNTLTREVLMFKTGSGEKTVLENSGPGIHWHIQNPVYYIATDEELQDIPWIQTEIDGEMVTYMSADANLSPEFIDDAEKHEMDCLDCHNRVTHLVEEPSNALDEAMAENLIPADIPYIKQQGVSVLGEHYDDRDAAMQAIDNIADYYRDELPTIYAERLPEIEQSLDEFRAIYDRTQFPFMKVYWDTYPNNVGHESDPGCFRCHDGKHLNDNNEAIRATCSLCHGIPVVGQSGKPLPRVELAVQPEPESHQNTLWLAEHRYAFDITCSECHTMTNPAGADDTSFCSNSACHGSGWDFLAIDSPEIVARVAPAHLSIEVPHPDQPPIVPHYLSDDMVCTNCHALDHVVPYPEDHVNYTAELCTACHRTSVQEADFQASQSAGEPADLTPPPAIPHPLDQRRNCQACHAVNGGFFPAPENHLGRSNETCLSCHSAVAKEEPTPPAEQNTTEELPPTESGEQIEETTGDTPGISADPVSLPAIPHPVEQRENCLTCHAVNSGSFPVPESHRGRPNDSCQGCHAPE